MARGGRHPPPRRRHPETADGRCQYKSIFAGTETAGASAEAGARARFFNDGVINSRVPSGCAGL